MADVSKREKLSAAKRKLKEFNKQKSNAKTADPEINLNEDHKVSATNVNAANGGSMNGHNKTPAHLNSVNNDHHVHDLPSPNNVTTAFNHSPVSAIVANKTADDIHQLSQRMNGLISDPILAGKHLQQDNTQHSPALSAFELEQRNRDLIAQVEQYMRTNDHLTKQLNDTRNQVQRLQHMVESDRSGFDEKLKRELGTLKEQLQVHIQTIGILVSEKTELQSALNQNQRSAEQLIGERDELSGRLKASRQRVAELEKNLGSAVNNNQKQDKANKEMSKDVDRLKIDIFKLNKANEDLQQQVSELHGKLQVKASENGRLEDETIELRGKLEMANLLVQQLQAGGGGQQADTVLVDQLTQEKNNLQNMLNQAEDAMRKVSRDKEQAVAQYQAYVDQMQVQSRQLHAQVNTLLDDKEHLLAQRKDLENTVAELQQRTAADVTEARDAIAVKQTLTDSIAKLQQELEQTTHLYNTQVADNGQLSRLISEQESLLEQQRSELQRFADSQVDHTKLLENMQSDKTALSRATAQNRELKTQLAELQNGFVKMSNENMELLTKLQSEQHVVKELSVRLTQQEEELEEIRSALSQRELQASITAAHSHDINRPRQVSVSESDYDGHVLDAASLSLVETMRRELAAAQDTINSLTSQNSELRGRMAEHSHITVPPSAGDKQLESMSAAIRQLEMERNEIMSQLKNEQHLRQDTQQKVAALQQQLDTQEPATINGQIVSKTQFDSLHHAMKQLEEKYMNAMRDKADLVEQLESSEHQLLQLQGETETIGEYVSLYQTQRNALRQRQVLNDEYIAQMSQEREVMLDKLQTLQGLVVRLLSEKQLHPDLSAAAAAVSTSALVQHTIVRDFTDTGAAREPVNPDQLLSRVTAAESQEDWPDYTNSSGEEDNNEDNNNKQLHRKHAKTLAQFQQSTPIAPIVRKALVENSIVEPPSNSLSLNNDTAQQIMYLLHEMGRSDAPKVYTEFGGVVQCANCQGPVVHL